MEQVEDYAFEEEKERENIMQHSFPSMKVWYKADEELGKKFGAFPLFWQDLKTWAPYKEVLKLFLMEGEKKAERSRKRKSKWGEKVAESKPVPKVAPIAAKVEEGSKKRKSRWEKASAGTGFLNNVSLNDRTQKMILLRAKLETINAKLITVSSDAILEGNNPNRSPSPEKEFDYMGNVSNDREARMRAKLEEEKQKILDELVNINPLFQQGTGDIRQKLSKKIYIPLRDHPSYNFIGLIIGPRGNTQKRMERETNTRIAIRGKGSSKEGSRGKKMVDDDDDLHVLITGERESDIAKAAKEIQSLLVPQDDLRNEHKQKQLRELALINGTLRDDDYCNICGDKGHRQYECPNREKSFKAVQVLCAKCGDASHPTSDCTQKEKTSAEKAAMNNEYLNFMQQLGEKSAGGANPANPTNAPWMQSPAVPTENATVPGSSGAPGTDSNIASAGAPGTVTAPTGVENGQMQTGYPQAAYYGQGYDAYSYAAQQQQWYGAQGWPQQQYNYGHAAQYPPAAPGQYTAPAHGQYGHAMPQAYAHPSGYYHQAPQAVHGAYPGAPPTGPPPPGQVPPPPPSGQPPQS